MDSRNYLKSKLICKSQHICRYLLKFPEIGWLGWGSKHERVTIKGMEGGKVGRGTKRKSNIEGDLGNEQ